MKYWSQQDNIIFRSERKKSSKFTFKLKRKKKNIKIFRFASKLNLKNTPGELRVIKSVRKTIFFEDSKNFLLRNQKTFFLSQIHFCQSNAT